MDLALNYSYPAPNTRHKRAKAHYQGNFIPTTINTSHNHPLVDISSTFRPSVHTTGFSPTVYRKQTEEEIVRTGTLAYSRFQRVYSSLHSYLNYRRRQSSIGGFRSKSTIVGLLNVGYIDVDGVKDTTNPNYPTLCNLHEALHKEGLWHYIHPSASRHEGKFRVLYRRNLTIYSTNHFDPETQTWSLDNPELGHIEALRDDDTPVEVNQNLVALIISILTAEFRAFSDILDRHNINSSGVDVSARNPSMHSKHITGNNNKIVDTEVYEGRELLCLG